MVLAGTLRPAATLSIECIFGVATLVTGADAAARGAAGAIASASSTLAA